MAAQDGSKRGTICFMKQRRDLFLLLALMAALVLFTIIGPAGNDDDALSAAPTTRSSGPDGALALLRWLEAQGYDARRLEFQDFTVEPATDVFFMLGPREPVTDAHAAMVLDWVDQGGTLIYASERLFGPDPLLNELDIDLRPFEDDQNEALFDSIEWAPVLQPVFDAPPLQAALVRTDRVLESERADVVPLLGRDTAYVLMGVQHGAGYVYVVSTLFPFTNDGLRTEQNAALLLNLLRRAPPDARVVFDEWHHGFFEPPSLRSAVLSNAWGWALMYALLTLVAYLVLSGRRFGRPIPLAEEVARRSSAEYVDNIADLLQRGGKRDYLRGHYLVALKRRLARPYGLNPALDDPAFAEELSRYRPIEQAELVELLRRLRCPNLNDEELLRLLAEADALEQR